MIDSPLSDLLSTGVDLRRCEPVLRFLGPLLGADGDQRPGSRLFSGVVRDSGPRFSAALQLHCVEPLRHRHRPGDTEGARYVIPVELPAHITVIFSILAVSVARLGESGVPV